MEKRECHGGGVLCWYCEADNCDDGFVIEQDGEPGANEAQYDI